MNSLREQADYVLNSGGGVASLTDAQLLAVLVGERAAEKLMGSYGDLVSMSRATEGGLIAKAGPALGRRVYVALRLSMRRSESRAQILNPESMYDLFKHIAQEPREVLLVAALDTRLRPIAVTKLYQWTIDSSVVRIAEIMRFLVDKNARGLAMAHNHPSGDPSPPTEDIRLTYDVKKACELMGFNFVDHVIVSGFPHIGKLFYSLREGGHV